MIRTETEIDAPPADGKPQTFTPEVRAVRENAELAWLGALRWRWLFSAEHRFVLSATGPE